MDSFAERLKTVRGNISQQKFAELLDMKQSAYGHYETGRSEPSLDVLLKIVEITNAPLYWLLGIETMGDRIRKAREAMSMTIPELAKRISMTDSYVAGIENGTIPPTDGIVFNVAKILGVTVAYLKGNEPLRHGSGISTSVSVHTESAHCPNCERLQRQIDLLMEEGIAKTRTIENLSKKK